MVRCKIVCIAHILFYLFVQLPTQAQLVAGFRADKTAGCSPLTVSFTNTTRGASANAIYTWNFGNGNALTTADAVDPVAAIYYTPRTYRVTLTVKDRRRTSKVSTNIIVYENPTIGFTITPASGCIPLIVTLASTSAPGSGTITQYFWDFGDGKTLKTASATAMDTFAMAGTYTPSLTATDSHGCSSTLAQPNAIVALQPPAAGFSEQSTRLCAVTDTARFTNTSTGASRYHWSFGDGGVSTQANPAHRYAAPGSYKVTLVAVNAGGCSDSVVQQIGVALSAPAITIGTGAICAGAPVRFTSTPAGSANWSFGDGSVATGNTVSHAFVNAGTYTVSLADTVGTCPAGVSRSITVNASPALGGFKTSENAVCAAPVLVNFTDTSKGGVRWQWNFTGLPRDTSTKKNPSFLFPVAQAYQTTLTSTNAQGCSSTVTQSVYPTGKTAGLQVQETLSPLASICAAVSVTCGALTSDSITRYAWTFGDGSAASGAHPTHTYTTPGTYTILLSYTTEHGCTGAASTDTVHVYPKPVAGFTFADSSKCGGNHLEIFHNQSDSAAQYDWVFGDGASQASGDSSVTHRYALPGVDTVLLIVTSPGCTPDTAKEVVNIVDKAVPRGAPLYTCAGNRDTVVLTDSTAGGSLYVWNWGDGSKPDTDFAYSPQRAHLYPGGGTYDATITGVFGSCTVTSLPIPVYVLSRQHPLLKSTVSAICGSGALPVTITGLDSNFLAINTIRGGYGYSLSRDQFPDTSRAITGSIRTAYTGSIGGLIGGEDSVRIILLSAGYGCADTTNNIAVRISGPRAAFTLTVGDPCSHGPVVFRDSSTATGGVALVSWRWRFGDSTQTLRTKGDTVMHVYTAPGDYVPTLEVTDAHGCTQTVAVSTGDTVVVAAPVANFYWSPLSILPGVPVTFYNTSKAAPGTTYTWTFFSDGSTAHASDSLRHTYGPISRDTVRLVATPPPGQPCADTSIQVVDVTSVSAVFTDSTAYLSFNGCPPMVAYFKSTTLNAVSVHWDFGDGATAGNNPMPSHTYYSPGSYVVVLTAYGAGGDSILARDTVRVNGPQAVLHSSITQACSPATDTLVATGSHSHTYTWDFGDGTVFVTADTLAIHRYAASGVYAPALLVSDSTGCQAVFHLNTPLVLDTLNVQPFSLRTVCDTGVLTFLPLISSLEADSLGKTLQYLWNFGTGRAADTAATQNTSFDFGVEGAYTVTLRVQSPSGCAATVPDTVQVAAPLNLQYPPHTDLCVGTTAVLRIQGSENYSYQWTPARTLTLMSDRSALVNADADTTYKVVVSGPFGCYTDTLSMTVSARPLPTITIAPPAPVSAGGSVTLHGTVSSDVVSQTWSPGLYLSCTTCAAPVSTPLDQISYTDTVYTVYGCKAADTVVVTLLCSEGSVRIPGGFTPNGDGNNDYFMPIGRGVKVVLHFQVYSRYGDLIYSAENLPIGERQTGIGWDGRNNGREMPPGTYVYVMEFECLAGQTFMQKGTVELIR